MSGRFDGKVAFVTGATSGIGRATALAFGREGASVVVADVATDGNQETARVIEQAGGQSLAVSCDVTRADDIKAALHTAVDRFGRLDIAFNNAGIEQPIKPAAEISDDEWDRLVAVNLRGAFLSMKHEIELMLQHGGGAIVNTSSGAGPPDPSPEASPHADHPHPKQHRHPERVSGPERGRVSRRTRPVEIAAQRSYAGRRWSSLTPRVAELDVAAMLTSRLDDMS
jgi:NAD(P)-dependent dehydrogenase (short-subunit alcohol dehydrogenase family)